MTDNRNRIASDIRIATNKRGGVIATPGAVAFNFDAKGVIHIAKKHAAPEELFAHAIDAGADDFEAVDDLYVITTAPEEILKVKEAIQSLGFVPDYAEVEMVPKNLVECDEANKKQNLALIEWLEGIEDVDEVWHNMAV
jgi:YebC/PmpR family DNA-binding regulatory protein